MLLSAVSVLVVAQSSSEIPEGLINNPVYRSYNINSTHVECGRRVIPVITEATRTISKSFRQYLSDKMGKHEIKEIQKQPYWALSIYFRK